jgi:hypothetical protein
MPLWVLALGSQSHSRESYDNLWRYHYAFFVSYFRREIITLLANISGIITMTHVHSA